MNTKRYQLRIGGLRERQGQIKAVDLQRVLEALRQTTLRTILLLTTGKGKGKGPNPKWLDATVDFTITGLNPGSTILDIQAPCLCETTSEAFAQQESWCEQPDLNDTALDLVALAIKEAKANKPSGDRFDDSVLEAILKFRKAGGTPGICYELLPQDSEHGGFTLDDRIFTQVDKRLRNLPAPRAHIVSGRLGQVGHDGRHFRLLVNQDSTLLGQLDREALSVEDLRPLWGKQTVVEGMVHFKANGQPRLIEARRISPRTKGGDIFEEMPLAEIREPRGSAEVRDRHIRSFDPIELGGAWPGDESIEELLADLD